MSKLSDKHREAVRQSNFRRSEQTREMNRRRVWTSEMLVKMSNTKRSRARDAKLKKAECLGIGRGIYSRWMNSNGYVMVSVVDHPILGTCSISEHRLVLAERLGRRPTSKEVGHHRDEVKHNNVDSNIELTNPSAHSRYHSTGKKTSPETRAKQSAAMVGRVLTEEHRRKIGSYRKTPEQIEIGAAKLRTTLAAKREAGTHRRGPDTEEVRARKKAAAKLAWDKRRAAGTNKFGPKTEEQKAHMSRKAAEMWERRRTAEPGSPDFYEPVKDDMGRFTKKT